MCPFQMQRTVSRLKQKRNHTKRRKVSHTNVVNIYATITINSMRCKQSASAFELVRLSLI